MDESSAVVRGTIKCAHALCHSLRLIIPYLDQLQLTFVQWHSSRLCNHYSVSSLMMVDLLFLTSKYISSIARTISISRVPFLPGPPSTSLAPCETSDSPTSQVAKSPKWKTSVRGCVCVSVCVVGVRIPPSYRHY